MDIPELHGANSFVSREASESLLAAVEKATQDPTAGVFGPGSISWHVHRESALFLGAGRAMLLQLAHPWVATAIAQHSQVLDKPIERFHNTFRIVFTMIFGSLAQATAAARHLYELHTYVQGTMPQAIAAYPHGSHYQANEIAALRWVFATLIDSAVLAYEYVMPPLSPQELESYYAQTKTLAMLFGLSPSSLPPDWDTFHRYCREMEHSNALGVSDSARAMAHDLLAGAGSWVRLPRWYRALTAAWLPTRFCHEFHLSLNSMDRRSMEHTRHWLPRLYRSLPQAARFVGPWHEAQARLAGRPVPVLARAGNRFWIGQPELPFAEG